MDPRDGYALVGNVKPAVDWSDAGVEVLEAGQDGEEDDDVNEQRDVALVLNEDAGGLGDDPVVRQPCDAHQDADDRGEKDAAGGEADRVDHARIQGAATRVGFVVDRAVEVDTRVDLEEVEPGLDALGLEVVTRLNGEEPERSDHQHEGDDLGEPLHYNGVAVEGWSLCCGRR